MNEAMKEALELSAKIKEDIAKADCELVYISEESLKLLKAGHEAVNETLESFRVYSDNLEAVRRSISIPDDLKYCEMNLIQEQALVQLSEAYTNSLLSIAILITKKENK